MFQVSPERSASTPTATATETTRYSIWIRIRNDFRSLLYTVLRKLFATTFANLDRFPSLALPAVAAVRHVPLIDCVFASIYKRQRQSPQWPVGSLTAHSARERRSSPFLGLEPAASLHSSLAARSTR